jgi:UTP:GlnB (protein PII) uridylyltransferase
MIPEFAPVVGRVHHDLYHVYTVDVHSVAATDRIRALMRGEFVQRYALACRLAVETHRPQRVLFATLLHDIGKVFGGKEHSIRGAAMPFDPTAFALDPNIEHFEAGAAPPHHVLHGCASRPVGPGDHRAVR